MTIYVLSDVGWDYSAVQGVYSTLELAMDSSGKKRNQFERDNYGVWSDKKFDCVIEEFTLDAPKDDGK